MQSCVCVFVCLREAAPPGNITREGVEVLEEAADTQVAVRADVLIAQVRIARERQLYAPITIRIEER
jgi:acid stress-induced BolA-like protein IbaG/YrbA